MKIQEVKPVAITPDNREKARDDQAEFLTVENIADRLKLPVSFFYAPVRRKGPDPIPCLKIGKYIRYRLPDVMSWIEKSQARG